MQLGYREYLERERANKMSEGLKGRELGVKEREADISQQRANTEQRRAASQNALEAAKTVGQFVQNLGSLQRGSPQGRLIDFIESFLGGSGKAIFGSILG